MVITARPRIHPPQPTPTPNDADRATARSVGACALGSAGVVGGSALGAYVSHRLAVAGSTGGMLFDRASLDALHRASGGIPRLVNVLAHKSLIVAYGKGEPAVSRDCVAAAIADTSSVEERPIPRESGPVRWVVTLLGMAASLAIGAAVSSAV